MNELNADLEILDLEELFSDMLLQEHIALTYFQVTLTAGFFCFYFDLKFEIVQMA